MKVLIFYTPRSKSTMLHDMMCKKFGLVGFGDTVTKSRIKNKNDTEYKPLIDYINNNDNICVKLNGNDFVGSELYKTVDYESFDKIIFLTRQNQVDAVLSYAYMNPSDSNTWHRKKDQSVELVAYSVPYCKVQHLLTGYISYEKIKRHILDHISDAVEVHDCEYDNVSLLINELELVDDIDLLPMDIDYRSLVTNYNEVLSMITRFWAENK